MSETIETRKENRTHGLALRSVHIYYHNYGKENAEIDHDTIYFEEPETLYIPLTVESIKDELWGRYCARFFSITDDEIEEFIKICEEHPLKGHELTLGYEQNYTSGQQDDEEHEVIYELLCFPLKPVIKLVEQSPITEAEAKIVRLMHTIDSKEIFEKV